MALRNESPNRRNSDETQPVEPVADGGREVGPELEAAPPGKAESLDWRGAAARVVCSVSAVLSVALLGRLLYTSGLPASELWLHVGVVVAALGSSALVLVNQHRRFVRPLNQIRDVLPEIREGKAPIDDLVRVGAPHMAGLVEEIAAVLRDLRQQRSAIARLEMETSQKVANRTDALQRTIGSLRAQATRDGLTGLFNRRMLDQHLPQLVDRTRAESSHLTLMMVDVDYFKEVNDTLGHAAGDRLLATIGQIIRSGIREEDLAFRFGGDEFCIVLPETARAQAEELGKRLTDLVDAYAKTLRLPYPPRLSIGYAFTQDIDTPTVENILKAADAELYATKQMRHSAAGKAPRAPRAA